MNAMRRLVLQPLRIGLTGGIGSGKSSVAQTLVDCGAALVDADAISRQLTAAGGSAIAEIARIFGTNAIDADGAMNREWMRQQVFDDVSARLRLAAIVHPLVGQESARQAAVASQQGSACIIFDIPLLVESGRWRQVVDQVLVVDCSEETQAARVMARSHWPRSLVDSAIATQATRPVRLAAADFCIYNDGLSLAALAWQVRQLARRFGL